MEPAPDRYAHLRIPDDTGRPLREEVARLFYSFGATWTWAS